MCSERNRKQQCTQTSHYWIIGVLHTGTEHLLSAKVIYTELLLLILSQQVRGHQCDRILLYVLSSESQSVVVIGSVWGSQRDGKGKSVCCVIEGEKTTTSMIRLETFHWLSLWKVCVFVLSGLRGGYGPDTIPALSIGAALPELHSSTDLQAASTPPQQWQGLCNYNDNIGTELMLISGPRRSTSIKKNSALILCFDCVVHKCR